MPGGIQSQVTIKSVAAAAAAAKSLQSCRTLLEIGLVREGTVVEK